MAVYQSQFTGSEIDVAINSISNKADTTYVDGKIAELRALIDELDLQINPIDPTNTYTVTVTSANTEQGTVTINPVKDVYTTGESILISAEAKEGYIFEKWNDDDTTNPRTIEISTNVTLQAIFKVLEISGGSE